MNYEDLRIIFTQTINPDATKRNQAEEILKGLENNYDFIISLPRTYMKDSDPIVKKVSTIFFKNCVERNWNFPQFHQTKIMLIEGILYLMINSDTTIITFYLTILRFILDTEPIENLSPIINNIGPCLFSDNELENYIGINILLVIQENDSLRYDTKVIHPLFESISKNVSEKLYLYLTKSQFKTACFYMKFISKLSRQYNGPQIFNDSNYYQFIFGLCKNILTLSDTNDFDKLRLIKWAMRFINKGTEKALKKFHKTSEINDFIATEGNIKEVYELTKLIITNHFRLENEYERAAYSAVEYEIILNHDKNTNRLIREDIFFFLNNLILKCYIFTEKDEMEYETPEIFLKNKHSFFESNLKTLSGSFFEDVCRRLIKKPNEFIKVISSFKALLYNYNQNQTKENAYIAYGVLHLISIISHQLDTFMKGELSDFIIEYIFPFLDSNFVFLRGQACFTIQFFNGNIIINQNILMAFDKVILLLRSNDFVLKVDAAQSINFFFNNQIVNQKLRTLIPEVTEIILLLNSRFDLESLSETLDLIISAYPEEISKFSPYLVKTLSEMVINHLKEDSKKVEIISNHLRTIETLFSSIEQPEVLNQMFCFAYNLIEIIFKNNFNDFQQEALDILTTYVSNVKIVYKQIWDFFEMILSLNETMLLDVLVEISCLIDVCILHGKNVILDERYFRLVMRFITTICNISYEEFFEEDLNYVSQIIERLLLVFESLVEPKIEEFITLLLKNRGFFEKDSSCWVYIFDVIMHCYIINPEKTTKCLEDMKYFYEFNNKLSEKRRLFKRVHDKKTILLFIGLLSSKPIVDLDYAKIGKTLVRAIKTLPSAIKKRNDLKEKEEAGEEEEEVDYGSCEDEMLEEDIYFETKLDKFNALGYIRNVLENIKPNTIGNNIVAHLDVKQQETIKKVFSQDLPKEI